MWYQNFIGCVDYVYQVITRLQSALLCTISTLHLYSEPTQLCNAILGMDRLQMQTMCGLMIKTSDVQDDELRAKRFFEHRLGVGCPQSQTMQIPIYVHNKLVDELKPKRSFEHRLFAGCLQMQTMYWLNSCRLQMG